MGSFSDRYGSKQDSTTYTIPKSQTHEEMNMVPVYDGEKIVRYVSAEDAAKIIAGDMPWPTTPENGERDGSPKSTATQEEAKLTPATPPERPGIFERSEKYKNVDLNPPAAPAMRPSAGPMTSIYASRIRQRPDISAGGEAGINKTIISAMGGGQGAMNEYNQGRTPEARASALRGIWSAGGVPVIGRGGIAGYEKRNEKGEIIPFVRAQVQDGRGVSGVFGTRGVDTGIVPGSEEAQARDVAMAARGSSSGVYGSPTVPYARLPPLRMSPTREKAMRGGVFNTVMPVKQPPQSIEDVKFRQEMALQGLKNEGELATARAQQEALTQREQAAAQQKMTEAQQKEFAEAERIKTVKAGDATTPSYVIGDGGVGYHVSIEKGEQVRRPFTPEETSAYKKSKSVTDLLSRKLESDNKSAVEWVYYSRTGKNREGKPAVPALINGGRELALVPIENIYDYEDVDKEGNPIYTNTLLSDIPFGNDLLNQTIQKTSSRLIKTKQ